MNRHDLPLSDIVVLDFSWVVAGPHATMMLSDLGATVIKVTSRRNIDVTRASCLREGNDDFDEEGGWVYQDLNHGKLNISLDLKNPLGRSIMEELLQKSDMVVCNYGKGAFHKLGMTYEELSKIKKDIIVINASGLGDYGPYSDFVTYAPVLQAITGIASLVGYEGETRPLDEYAPIADYIGGMTIANYLLAALAWRQKTGEGQFIDMSQGESTSVYLGPALLDMQVNHNTGGIIGCRDWGRRAAPHNVYPCADNRWCVIETTTEEEWQALSQIIDPEFQWTHDTAFFTLESRLDHLAELDRHISEWTSLHTADEIGDLLQANGVPAAPVQTARDCYTRDYHLRERGFFREIAFEPSDRWPESLWVTGAIPRLADIDYPTRVPPAVSTGHDTETVLQHFLGKSQEWIADARKEGAFG